MKTILNIVFLVSGLITISDFTFSQCVSCSSTNPVLLPSMNPGVKVCITVDEIYNGGVTFNGGEIHVCAGANLTLNGQITVNSGGIRFSGCSTMTINGNVVNNEKYGISIIDNCNCPNAITQTGTWLYFPIWCGPIPLPVELLSFDASCGNNNDVNIEWTTASEINNSHFLLDRSIDVINWDSIARVEGAGNSNELKNYSYSDHLPSVGTYYYRLTQVDFDGQTEVFDFITVTCTAINADLAEVKIYPNPASDILTVQLPNSSSSNDLNIEIVNFSGQVMMSRVVYANQSGPQSFDISGLGNGIFIVRISGIDLNQSTKLVVSKTGGAKKEISYQRHTTPY